MKEYPVELVQPLGSHNPKSNCIRSEHVKQYISLPFEFLNPLQSEFLPYLEDDDVNIVVASPTSSGKTLCAELFAARGISLGKKILYIAPMKALADEKYEEWSEPSHTFSNFSCEIITGDFILDDVKKKKLDNANIICLTPEMFNSKCRFYENHEWLHNTWIVVDEAHLIGMENRGDSLEIGLVQYYESSKESRSLLISATIPNVKDFGVWLEHLSDRKSKTIVNNYRPCKLNKHFQPFKDSDYGRRIAYADKEQKRLEATIEMVQRFKNEPTLVFVGNKDFGNRLSTSLKALGINYHFHNADLDREKRHIIEKGFKNLDFNILIATTTLAWGCFDVDSQISTDSGFVDISDENKGKIISFCDFEKNSSNVMNKIIVGNKIPMKRIVLKSGLSVVCTEDHSFPIFSGGEKKASEINVGDELISDSNINLSNSDIYNDLSDKACYLIGFMAGDGHLSNKSIDFCVPDIDIRKKVKKCLSDLGFGYRNSKNNFDEVEHVVSRKECRDFFTNYVKYSSKKEKIIKYDLIGLDDNKIFNTLAGLMDSDGGIDDNKICFYNTSYHLINFFVLAMKRFGIETSVRLRNNAKCKLMNKKGEEKEINGKKKCYELIIGSSAGYSFFNENILPLMVCCFRKNKINKIFKKSYYGSIFKLNNGSISSSVYGLKDKKIFSLFKNTIEYSLKNSGVPMSLILKNIDKERLFSRKNIFDGFFDYKLSKINGKGKPRKHYTPNALGRLLSISENFESFIDLSVSNGFDPEFKKQRNISSSKIKDFSSERVRYIIDEEPSDIVMDLSVLDNDHHHYIVNGIVTHNCNTPARYVIQTHTSFGITPMHPANVIQSIGRAGRAGYSDKGDAYILVGESEMKKESDRIFKEYKVTSVMNDINTLMFHVLSYVVTGKIKNSTDLYEWYRKTLSSVQKNHINENTSKAVLENLKSRYMIRLNDKGEYEATKLGEIAAQMYMSPLDLSDWFQNFSKLKYINPPKGCAENIKDRINLLVAKSFAESYSYGITKHGKKEVLNKSVYITNREKQCESVCEVSNKLKIDPSSYPHVKYVAIFYSLLSGRDVEPLLYSSSYAITKDIDRVIQSLKMSDEKIGKVFKDSGKCSGYGWNKEWDILMERLKYGVDVKYIDLVRIPGIGKAYAEQLFEKGIKTINDVRSKPKLSIDILGNKRYQKIMNNI